MDQSRTVHSGHESLVPCTHRRSTRETRLASCKRIMASESVAATLHNGPLVLAPRPQAVTVYDSDRIGPHGYQMFVLVTPPTVSESRSSSLSDHDSVARRRNTEPVTAQSPGPAGPRRCRSSRTQSSGTIGTPSHAFKIQCLGRGDRSRCWTATAYE